MARKSIWHRENVVGGISPIWLGRKFVYSRVGHGSIGKKRGSLVHPGIRAASWGGTERI